MSKQIKRGDKVKFTLRTPQWPYAKAVEATVTCEWLNGDFSVAWEENGDACTFEQFMRVEPEWVSAVE